MAEVGGAGTDVEHFAAGANYWVKRYLAEVGGAGTGVEHFGRCCGDIRCISSLLKKHKDLIKAHERVSGF